MNKNRDYLDGRNLEIENAVPKQIYLTWQVINDITRCQAANHDQFTAKSQKGSIKIWQL